jgi:DNA-binding MarR family transcriptional regulator
MNKTVQLVNEWGRFEEHHPDGNIEDFCRLFLAKKSEEKGVLTGGVAPPTSQGLLLKIIGRIHKLNMIYATSALAGTGLNQVEEFGILLTIQKEVNPRKTDIIFANLFELSSGTDMLNRLLKRKLIKESKDVEDKRSKRIELTSAGEYAIELSKRKMGKLSRMMMNDLTEDDRQICIQLLKDIEIKFSASWQKHKGKPFDDIYTDVTRKVEDTNTI